MLTGVFCICSPQLSQIASRLPGRSTAEPMPSRTMPNKISTPICSRIVVHVPPAASSSIASIQLPRNSPFNAQQPVSQNNDARCLNECEKGIVRQFFRDILIGRTSVEALVEGVDLFIRHSIRRIIPLRVGADKCSDKLTKERKQMIHFLIVDDDPFIRESLMLIVGYG